MANLVLPAKEAQIIVSEGDDDYELLSQKVIDEWRWGNVYESVIKDSEGKLWGVTYRVQSNDNYYHSFEDLDEVEFYPVEAVTVKRVVYRQIKD